MTTRILYLIPGLGTGGAERSLAELLPFVTEAGYEPTVVCFYSRPEGVHDAVRAQGVDVRLLDGDGRFSRVARVRRIIREVRPGLIHTGLFEATMVGRMAAVGTRVPLLTSLVNTSYTPLRSGDANISPWKHRAVQELDRWSGRWSTTHFHAITEAVKDAAVRDLSIPPDRITVVERGRDPARLGEPSPERRARARAELGLASDDVVLVNAGRQEYQKGQRYLLEAMPRIIDAHDRVVLLVAGRTGRATPDLERASADLVRRGYVQFLGHREDLPEVLAAADLFVFPSLFEGLGGAVIEAMALGLPIVGSDIPALGEVLDDGRNADLVPPASSAPLAEAILALLQAPERMRRYASRSRAIFDERFTLKRSATGTLELYADLLAEDDDVHAHGPTPRARGLG